VVVHATSPRNQATARPPTFATVPAPEEVIPPRRRETIRGMTVIRMALTQSPPMGSIQVTAVAAHPVSAGAMAIPRTRPRTNPMSTRVVRDIRNPRACGGLVRVDGRGVLLPPTPPTPPRTP